MRLRWRRQGSERGLARVCQGWRGYELWYGDCKIVIVAGHGDRYSPTSFYWYGCDRNTLRDGVVFSTPEEAKTDAMAVAKKWVAKSGGAV